MTGYEKDVYYGTSSVIFGIYIVSPWRYPDVIKALKTLMFTKKISSEYFSLRTNIVNRDKFLKSSRNIYHLIEWKHHRFRERKLKFHLFPNRIRIGVSTDEMKDDQTFHEFKMYVLSELQKVGIDGNKHPLIFMSY